MNSDQQRLASVSAAEKVTVTVPVAPVITIRPLAVVATIVVVVRPNEWAHCHSSGVTSKVNRNSIVVD
jgi:hypothetical protein